MACRDISKGKAAAESLLHTIKDAKIEVRSLDLTNFRSMRTFVKEIDHCDILVNNAGAMFPILDFVSCGSEKIEKTFMTNYLGPFYLTISLLPIMGVNKEKASDDYPERRIVNVGSRLEKRSSLRDTMKSTSIQKILRETFVNGLNGNGDSKYNMWTAYANSKLCNLLFTYELSRRLTQDSYDHTNMRTSNIVVNAGKIILPTKYSPGLVIFFCFKVTPGMVNTNLSRWLPTWQRFALAPILPLVLRSPNQGAEAVVRVATSPALKGISGRFFDEKETPFDSSAASQSKEIASSLWEESVRLIRSIEREIEEEDRLSAISNGQR